MMKRHAMAARPRRVLAAVAALALLLGVRALSTSSPASAADATTKYFGVFREGAPTQTASAASSAYGVTPASVMWFDSWATGKAFPVSEAKALWSRGIMPHYTWEPWDTALGANGAGQIKLQDIINGTWDSYIRTRAAEFASAGVPILLRWGHEFNGDWYPWGTANNNNDPTRYVQAYRHVHDLVKAAGATNVQWVWAFNNGSSPTAAWNDPARAYPGSAYVDWVGVDGYNWGSGPSWDPTGNHWASFSTTFSTAYQNARSIAADKPVMIAEYASSADGGDKAAWFNDMDAQLKSGAYPDLKLLTYFDQDKEELWSAGSSSAGLTAFVSWLKQPYMSGKGADLAQVAAQYGGTPPPPPTTPATSPVTTPATTPVTTPATTPVTTPATTTPAPSDGSGPATCTATYQQIARWNGGLLGSVTVTNNGTSAINGWTVKLTLGAGQSLINVWNGTNTGTSGTVTVTNASYNATVAAKGSQQFGFVANGNAAVAPAVVTCTPTMR
ncbi:MAG TPA: cellulose binding domain-containing protein [Kineosporiaceae bacterium]|nr:cellulose binding domain-containing protein [Kineosporiaceae bacterium]